MSVITKSRSRDGQISLSEHFKVYEFASTAPSPYNPTKVYSDEVKICEELVAKLEDLMKKIHANTAYISSGYRTSEHDKAVGGNGAGQHVLGRAVDVIFYDSNKKTIDNRIISCVAQDMGFKGIARINTFGYIHLDMRVSGTYLGNETRGTNTVTNSFRQYYGITEDQIAAVTGDHNVRYYPRYTGQATTIANALKAMNIDSSYAHRKKIAAANNITGYIGTAAQNTYMLRLLKDGRLIKV